MTDITKCSGQIEDLNCPYKENCYRDTAKADVYQSYFIGLPLINGKCDAYWSKDGEKIHNKTKTNDDSKLLPSLFPLPLKEKYTRWQRIKILFRKILSVSLKQIKK